MTRGPGLTSKLDIAAAAARLTDAMGQGGQPDAAFQAFDRLVGDALGHRLFTVLGWRDGSSEVERLHSSRPGDYPLLARKAMRPTPWGALVLKQGQSWFGRNAADIRWAFPDHELIASLGCASCLNAPVRYDGTVAGVVSVLDAEGRYTDADLHALQCLSGFLAAPLLQAAAAAAKDRP